MIVINRPPSVESLVGSTARLRRTPTTTSTSTCTIAPPRRLFLATAAQKRKLQRNGFIKERGRSTIVEKEQLTTLTQESIRQRQGFQWSPALVFLGIFPTAMTGLVLATRGDLRQQVMDILLLGMGGNSNDTSTTSSSSSTKDPNNHIPTTTIHTKKEEQVQ
jgi:hypothetical protein